MGEQGYGLNGLSQSHLISKNTIYALLEEIIKPSKTLNLILF